MIDDEIVYGFYLKSIKTYFNICVFMGTQFNEVISITFEVQIYPHEISK